MCKICRSGLREATRLGWGQQPSMPSSGSRVQGPTSGPEHFNFGHLSTPGEKRDRRTQEGREKT